MNAQDPTRYSAFEGFHSIASGSLLEVAASVKRVIDRGEWVLILIFNDTTGEQVEIDFRGTPEDVAQRVEKQAGTVLATSDGGSGRDAPRGPGRPRLGVIAREVTLLPRHWHWLNTQPGGASVALRKLVEQARRANEGRDRARQALEATYRFMSALCGNLPGFEEATRALFAKDPNRLAKEIQDWPKDVRKHLSRLVEECLRLDREAAAPTAKVLSTAP